MSHNRQHAETCVSFCFDAEIIFNLNIYLINVFQRRLHMRKLFEMALELIVLMVKMLVSVRDILFLIMKSQRLYWTLKIINEITPIFNKKKSLVIKIFFYEGVGFILSFNSHRLVSHWF